METRTPLEELMLTNPPEFIKQLMKQDNPLSLQTAQMLDEKDQLRDTRNQFDIDEKLIPFASHSLGAPSKLALEAITNIHHLHKKLHAGHFAESHPEGKQKANYFDCHLHEPSMEGAQQLLGFADQSEFCFTANGLTDNLTKVMDAFYAPDYDDWRNDRTRIVILKGEFFSDQTAVTSIIEREIATAVRLKALPPGEKPSAKDLIIHLPHNNGLYNEDVIIEIIRMNADKIKLISLSDIVFNTGQRLQLHKIFSALKEVIEKNNIVVGLDLAHTVGNRPIDLKSFPVMIYYAVGCGYKHLSGYAGSSFGICVNKNADLSKKPPLQGWKAVAPENTKDLFARINSYAPITVQHGALAFQTSNPPPAALAPVQSFLTYFGKIGFGWCFNKSESLTLYLLEQLKFHLREQIDFVTPLAPEKRGAMIVFSVKNIANVGTVQKQLEEAGFEIDVRPPRNLRLTAHYAYTRLQDIQRMVSALKVVLEKELRKDAKVAELIVAQREKDGMLSGNTPQTAEPRPSGSVTEHDRGINRVP